jgi:flagellar basal body-associated protein FliL
MFLLISLGLLTSYTCFRGNRVVRSFIFLNIIYFLGIGVKENFFIFLVLITYVLVKNWSRINSVGKFLFLLVYLNSIIWTMLYVVNILNEYFVSKSDIYGDSRDFTSTLIALTENRYFLYSIFPLFALLVIGVLNFWFNKNKVISLNLFRSSIVFGLLIFLSESFFYQHNIADLNFSTPRYSMFSALAFNLIFITALLKIQVEIQGVFERKNSRALIIALILTSVIFVYAIMTATYSTLFKYNQKSIRNSNQLKSEMNSILAGMDQLDVLSTNQVVVIVNGPWQYEYLYSIATYSQHYSKKKVNVFAEVQIDLDALETNFEQRLSAEMIKDSILGNSQNRNNIKPLSALKRNRPVVCLSMPGSVIPSFCTADLLINPYSRTW